MSISHRKTVWTYHGSHGRTLTAEARVQSWARPCRILRRTSWQQDRLISEHLIFALSVLFPQMLHNHSFFSHIRYMQSTQPTARLVTQMERRGATRIVFKSFGTQPMGDFFNWRIYILLKSWFRPGVHIFSRSFGAKPMGDFFNRRIYILLKSWFRPGVHIFSRSFGTKQMGDFFNRRIYILLKSWFRPGVHIFSRSFGTKTMGDFFKLTNIHTFKIMI